MLYLFTIHYKIKTMTKDELIHEWIKCAEDFEYFAETYLKTEDKSKNELVPFRLMPHQNDLVGLYDSNDLVITNKYRQSGITSVTCAYIAWIVCFNNDVKVGFVANQLDHAKTELLKRTDDFIINLPDFLRPNYTKNSEKYKIYSNGCELFAKAANSSGLRGHSPRIVVIDEFAFINEDQEFYTAAKSVWSTGGKCFIISTPNGSTNMFYQIFKLAIENKNGFKANELKWYHDIRLNKNLKWVNGNEIIEEFNKESQKELILKGFKPTSPWFEKECAGFNFDKRKIAQELEGEFLGSGGCFIDEVLLLEQENDYVTKPLYYEWVDKSFWVWKYPINEEQKFVFGVDVSSGKAEDYSTICVLDSETQEMYAEYRNRVEPDELADVVYHFAKIYNFPLVAIDTTGGYGAITVKKMMNEYNYKNIYYSEIKDRHIKDKLEDESKGNLTPGIVIGKNRNDILEAMNSAFNKKEIIIRSSRTINELKEFKFLNGKPDHKRTGTSDNIFSLAIALFINDKSGGKNLQSIERAKVLLSSWIVANYNDEDFLLQQHKFEQNNKNTKKIAPQFWFN